MFTVKPVGDVSAADVRECLREAYEGERFVHVLPGEQLPRTSSTYGSNLVLLQGNVDLDSGRIIITSAIDNLGKGAAGQAVQCANLVLGLEETTGLLSGGVAP